MKIYDLNESYSIIDFSNHPDEEAIKLREKLTQDLSVYVDGYKYSPKYKAGLWDGKKHFYTVEPNFNIKIPKGLVQSVIKRYGKFLEKEYKPLNEVEKVPDEEIKQHIDSLNLPFELRDYQFEAVKEFINNPRRILVAATSSGKSLIIYVSLTYFMNKGKKCLLIVPDVGLVNQMYSDFESYGMKDIEKHVHKIFAGKEKTFRYPITITTWQSAILMKESEFDQIEVLVVDEAHKAAAESLQHLIAYAKNSIWKIGLTGTLPKQATARFALAASLGKTKTIVTAQGLIERGLATPVKIISVYINYSEEDKKKLKALKNKKSLVGKQKIDAEMKFISEHEKRNKILAKMAIKVSTKKGNTLVIYKHLSHGKMILNTILSEKYNIKDPFVVEKVTHKRIQEILEKYPNGKGLFLLTEPNEKEKKILQKYFSDEEIKNIGVLSELGIYLIKGSIEGEQRNRIRKTLETKEDAILIGSSQTVSTGMNIKRLHNIFIAASFKSSILLNQTIGRGMRLHEEKEVMRLFDFIDDFSEKRGSKVVNKNYALKHAMERLNDYLEHGYPIEEIEINL